MRLQIYDFSYNLIWETHECEHWFISNRPDNEHPYSYVQLQFTNRNMETDFRWHLEELSDQRETFFFVIDTHDGLRRCIIFNPRLKIFRPLHNDNNVIDLTSNLIMSKEQYYQLFEVEELNCISYEEYLNEKDDSIKFDESKTLYELLRNALYKRYLKEKDIYFL